MTFEQTLAEIARQRVTVRAIRENGEPTLDIDGRATRKLRRAIVANRDEIWAHFAGLDIETYWLPMTSEERLSLKESKAP